jgi:hypothetical protein
VPNAAKTDPVREMELYLGTMMRQVDSSLLEEWEKMRDPGWQPRADSPGVSRGELRPPSAEAPDVTRDPKSFTALIRNQIFSFLRGLILADFDQALTHLHSPKDPDGGPWTADRLARAVKAHQAEHQRICLDPEARNLRHTYVIPSTTECTGRCSKSWSIRRPPRLGGGVQGGSGRLARGRRAVAPAESDRSDWRWVS